MTPALTDLIRRLRALAAHDNDDHDIAEEAADALEAFAHMQGAPAESYEVEGGRWAYYPDAKPAPPMSDMLRAVLRYPAGMPPPATITDDFGNWWPRLCPDCGAEMVIDRPGRATCSAECWQDETDDRGGL